MTNDVTCNLCGEVFEEDILNHMRLMHSDVMNEARKWAAMTLLSPVTLDMHNEDWVCEKCNNQFVIGQVFGEIFEGMVGSFPLVSRVCGTCFMEEL